MGDIGTFQNLYLRSVMAAYESPKLLVAVRVRAGMPKQSVCNVNLVDGLVWN